MRIKILVFVFSLLYLSISAQSIDKGIKAWKANWISNPDTSIKQNHWSVFKKSIDIQSQADIAQATAFISADSKYWLYINEKLVVYEGNLKRGPNRMDGYYDFVDLSKHLKVGSNDIEILLWYWGREGFSHKNSGKGGLIFELKMGKQTLISDESWQVATHPSYYTTKNQNPNYRLPEFNVAFDARLNNWKWSNAVEAGMPPVKPWGELWKRPIPMWKDFGLTDYKSVKITKTDSTTVAVCKLKENLTIGAYLEIRTETEGFIIDIRTDNYIGGSEPNLRTEYIAKNGVQKFESLGYFNGHEVIYILPKDVEIVALKYRETRYDTDYIGVFETNNSRLNSLIEKSKVTLNVNMRDGIQDPDRERAQWWGDVVNIMGEIHYTLDEKGYKSLDKSISNLVEWQKDDGVLFSPIPAGSWDKELPSQMLASIGEFGFWKHFVYTRDTKLIHYVYPFIKKYIDLWSVVDGNVQHRHGGWSWYDWGDTIDYKLLDQLWYYQALQSFEKMALLVGKHNEVIDQINLLPQIKYNILQNYWQGEYFASSDFFKGKFDDRANGLAALLDLTDHAKWAKMKMPLFNARRAGPYMEKYIVEAFFHHGDAHLGFDRMMDRYSEMIDSPVSSLWEGWKVGSGSYGGGTYNHGWSGWPINTSGQFIAGIIPHEFLHNTFQWRPQLSVLNKAHYKFNLLNQVLAITYLRSGPKSKITLNTSNSCNFEVKLFQNELLDVKSIRLNGIMIKRKHTSHPFKSTSFFIVDQFGDINIRVKSSKIELELRN